MPSDAYQLLFQNGSIDLNATSGATTFTEPNIPKALHAINGAAVAFSAITDGKNTGDLVTSVADGDTIYGHFTQLTVSSGQVRCYY